jgi:hypothetical protein
MRQVPEQLVEAPEGRDRERGCASTSRRVRRAKVPGEAGRHSVCPSGRNDPSPHETHVSDESSLLPVGQTHGAEVC